MSAIPLHIQRRFEQRWAARFVPPVALISSKSLDFETCSADKSPNPQAKEKPTGMNPRAQSTLP